MRRTLRGLKWAVVLGGASSCGGGQSGASPYAREFVTAHNAVRAAVQPAASPALPDVAWDDSVATTAQAYANGCRFQHSGASGLGENIYASTGTGAPTPTAVTQSWAGEAAQYDYASNACRSGACGHYTQIVWRSSVGLGCGTATCTQNSPFGSSGTWYFVVCNYRPAGNFVGQRPY